MSAAGNLVALSKFFDAANGERFSKMTRPELEAELAMMHRVIKSGEEGGEAVAATIGVTGANPRKGVTHAVSDQVREELDAALTHLGNVEHLTGNRGTSFHLLESHIAFVAQRVGVAA